MVVVVVLMVVSDGGGGVTKCILGVGVVGSAVCWM